MIEIKKVWDQCNGKFLELSLTWDTAGLSWSVYLESKEQQTENIEISWSGWNYFSILLNYRKSNNEWDCIFIRKDNSTLV